LSFGLCFICFCPLVHLSSACACACRLLMLCRHHRSRCRHLEERKKRKSN
jgi:hypothetical protein